MVEFEESVSSVYLIPDWFRDPQGRILLHSNGLDWSMNIKDLLEEC